MHPRHHAHIRPDTPAIIMADTGETLDYAALETRANQVAHWLRDRGVRTCDVVALQLDNNIPLYALVWGAQRAGVHYLMVPTKLSAGELDYIVRDSGTRLLIRSVATLTSSSGWMQPDDVAVHQLDTVLAQLDACPLTPITDEAPGADMLYSSGTTGRPKGIKGAMPASLDAPTRAERIGATHFGFSRDSIYLAPAPLYHAAPLRWSLAIHRHGGTVVLMRRFDAEAALAAIERFHVTVAQFVPTHFARLLALPDAVRTTYDVSSLRSLFHAGAPCPVQLKRNMIAWLGPIVHEFYSGTEGLGICVILADEWLARPGSVGRAVEGTIRICDDDGEPLPVGRDGIVRFENASPFAYHGDTDRTVATYNRHGWPTLGDVGRIDDAGYLTLTDRADFMIISGGVNVYPQEIEDRLIDHPLVADAAVFGLPDPDLGERVTAVVEPATGMTDMLELENVLRAYAHDHLAPAKRPRTYVFRCSLERTDTGKLTKKRMRADMIAQETQETTHG